MAHYQNDEGAGEIVSTIESNGGQALAAPMSLEEHTSIQKAIAETTDRFDSVDVLVNNAVFWGKSRQTVLHVLKI